MDMGALMRLTLSLLFFCLLCVSGYSAGDNMASKKELAQKINQVKRNGRINKWYAVVSVTKAESAIVETVIVEMQRSNDIVITHYRPNITKGFDVKSGVISPTDRRYSAIRKIEHAELKISSWSGGIILDGDSYQVEIDAVDTKTVMNLTEKSFEHGLMPVKQWIDFLRKCLD